MSSDMAQVGSFRAMSAWMQSLTNQTRGSVISGYKADRITFGGGVATSYNNGTRGYLHRAEQKVNSTGYIDWSQGDITATYANDSYAINGEGLFAVASSLAVGVPVHLTRNGEFHKDENGYYRDTRGNFLLNAEDIDPMGMVTRDPVRFGRPFPSPLEPFPPGATGVTDANFGGAKTVVGNYVEPLTGAGSMTPVNVTFFDFASAPLGTGGPSPTDWMATAGYAGYDDSAYTGGVNRAGQTIGWHQRWGDGNFGTWGFHYGSNAETDYATGTNASSTLDYMLDWSDAPSWHDIDLNVLEADGTLIKYNNHYGNGWLNRDQQNGMRPGGATYSDWDEWYHLDTLKANATGAGTTYDFTYDDTTYAGPNYFGGVAAGSYDLRAKEASSTNTSVNWQVVQDAGTFRESIASGTQALAADSTVSIQKLLVGDRSNQGSVSSPEYNISGLQDGYVYWDQRSQVESLANVDTMTFQYRYDGGGWSAPIDIKNMTANNNAYATIAPIVLAGFTGHSTVQFQWNFDTVDGKNNTGWGWGMDNFNLKARKQTGTSQLDFDIWDAGDPVVGGDTILKAGDKIQFLNDTGGVEQTHTFTGAEIAALAGGGSTHVNLPITDTTAPLPSKWPFTNGKIQFVAGGGNPGFTAGTVISEHTYAQLQIDEDGKIFLADKRGFEAALYDDYRNELKASAGGTGYYDTTNFKNVPQFMKWDDGTQPVGYRAGKLVRNALEASNVNTQQLADEMVMAQRMYDGLTKVLLASKESTLALIDAIR